MFRARTVRAGILFAIAAAGTISCGETKFTQPNLKTDVIAVRGFERFLNSAQRESRELLLAQASDWAFIMKSGTLVPYAWRRTEEHLDRFERLAAALRGGAIDEAEVAEMEERYGLFPDLDPGLFA